MIGPRLAWPFRRPAPGVQVRLFLSTVSSEFRTYRDALRGLLARPNVTVHVQEDFIASGVDTLSKLDDYIGHCDAVIHLAGDMTGAWASDPTRLALQARYPDFAERLPALKVALETGDPPLSYTQWEAYLALYHRKPLLIATPEPDAPRDSTFQATDEQKAAQAAHLQRLAALGRHPEIRFASVDQLANGVLRSAVLDLLAGARPPFWTRRRTLAAGAGGAVVAGAGLWLAWPQLFPPPPNAAGVAVLPFENDTNDPSLAYLGASAPVELTQALTDLSDLSVVPFASVRSIADARKGLAMMARELGVAHLVGGYLTRQAGGTALSADIYDAVRGVSVRVQADATEPTRLVSLIVARVAEALQLALQAPEAADALGAKDDAAYRLYLQAVAVGLDLTDENNLKAISLLEEAVAKAPGFARGQAALAQAYLTRFYWLHGGPAWVANGLAAARQSVKLAPGSVEAQTALAFAYECGGQRKAAILAYAAAAKTNPRYAPALQNMARYRFYMGDFDDSLELWGAVGRIDTVANDPRIRIAMCHFFKGDTDQARAWNVQAEARAHGVDELTLVSFTYAWLKDFDAAQRVLAALKAQDATAQQIAEIEAWLAVEQGDRAAAAVKLRQLAPLAAQKYGLQDELATLHAILGDKAEALSWLSQAITHGAPNYAWYASDFFAALKGDPQYQALLAPLAAEYADVRRQLPAPG
jgi:TolB-like protein